MGQAKLTVWLSLLAIGSAGALCAHHLYFSSRRPLAAYNLSTPSAAARSLVEIEVDGNGRARAELQSLEWQRQNGAVQKLEIAREVEVSDTRRLLFLSYEVGKRQQKTMVCDKDSADGLWYPTGTGGKVGKSVPEDLRKAIRASEEPGKDAKAKPAKETRQP